MRARWMAFTVLCACASSKTQEIKTTQETHTSVRETTASETVTTRTEGPERTTTTVEEFEVAGGGVAPPTEGYEPPLSTGSPRATRQTVPPAPVLVKRTVIVKESGPILTESHSEGRTASETHADSKADAKASSQSSTRLGPPGWVWVLIPVAVLAAIALAWKLRLWFVG